MAVGSRLSQDRVCYSGSLKGPGGSFKGDIDIDVEVEIR